MAFSRWFQAPYAWIVPRGCVNAKSCALPSDTYTKRAVEPCSVRRASDTANLDSFRNPSLLLNLPIGQKGNAHTLSIPLGGQSNPIGHIT